ncbi:peptidoglycan-associated lipoprotein Pal [Parvibaculum sp.]|jgi:peptidoglycan-associated lipoprotein|uniref:peptidoglycan-associated lipoprotein Pal n=1 Tax=Parvibaculum sp. TaxID=2024848 RepID=UPI000C434F8C|nr:peptidoglycan-associated lipoprotein Pal [Parvibaculum sp.]MAM94693.1 peptidoglycan-associated lipoprotein [Parvibaculum sp.]|tara:strand:- start:8944 stop:9447 length:504 start_codon:yes stop_codon:yes gene_type:complete
MKSPNAGLRFAAVAAAFLMLAACSSTDESAGANTSPSSSSSTIASGSQEDLVANVGDRVFFDTDRSSLSDEARATLQRQAAWMKLYPNLTFTIEGHADERGTREYNLALGGRRANSAKDYLVSLGVDGSRLNTVSYGKERPVCLESNENCWAQNRRAVTVVVSGAAS